MTAPLFFSRARLRNDGPIAALAPILLPPDHDQRLAVAHRLLWTLFSDGPDRRRDFLWREEGSGKSVREGFFYILSMRAPSDSHGLFDLETKPFAPVLAEGDRLGFILRANAVVTRKDVEGRSQRHDVVMDRLHKLQSGTRAAERRSAIDEAGRAWLDDQAQRHGFLVQKGLSVDGYHTAEVERPGHRPVSFSTLDFSGALTIVQPHLFVAAIGQGFGKAKSFGCGLMLIRRV
jgi:CRISPR system Cascade subunit CasE